MPSTMKCEFEKGRGKGGEMDEDRTERLDGGEWWYKNYVLRNNEMKLFKIMKIIIVLDPSWVFMMKSTREKAECSWKSCDDCNCKITLSEGCLDWTYQLFSLQRDSHSHRFLEITFRLCPVNKDKKVGIIHNPFTGCIHLVSLSLFFSHRRN